MVHVQHSEERGAATSTKLLMSQMINTFSSLISICEIPIPWLYGLMAALRNYEEQGRTSQLQKVQLNVILKDPYIAYIYVPYVTYLRPYVLMSIIGNWIPKTDHTGFIQEKL